MSSFLSQLTITDLFAGFVILLAIGALAVWLLRKRLKFKEIELGGGPVKVKFEENKPPTSSAQVNASQTQSKGVSIRGNKMFGKNKIKVFDNTANVSDGAMVGENEIQVGQPNNKSSK